LSQTDAKPKSNRWWPIAAAIVILLGLAFFGGWMPGGPGSTDIEPRVVRTPDDLNHAVEDAEKLSKDPLQRFVEDKPLSAKDKNDLLHAAAILQGIVAYEPTAVNPLLGLGLTYRALEQDENAEMYFQRVVDLAGPSSTDEAKLAVAESRYNLALILIQRREYDKARELAAEAVAAAPNSANYHAALAEAFLQLDRKSDAVIEIRVALNLDPTNKRALRLKKLVDAALNG
jgi:tetratricopeptide (TPR) repeat protein